MAGLSAYQASVSVARSKCEKAFDEAAERHLDDLDRAKAVMAAKDEFLKSDKLNPPAGPAPPQQAPPIGEMKKIVRDAEMVRGVKVQIGDPQFTLLWDTGADLDIHVIEPGGSEIFWEARNGKQGGILDVDDVEGFGPENV